MSVTSHTMDASEPPAQSAPWDVKLVTKFNATGRANLNAFLAELNSIVDREQYDDKDKTLVARYNFTSELSTRWITFIAEKYGISGTRIPWAECYEWMESQIPSKSVDGLGSLQRLMESRQRPGQTVASYVRYIERLRAALPHTLPEEFWVHYTFLSLDPEQRFKIFTSSLELPKDLTSFKHQAAAINASATASSAPNPSSHGRKRARSVGDDEESYPRKSRKRGGYKGRGRSNKSRRQTQG